MAFHCQKTQTGLTDVVKFIETKGMWLS